MAIELFRENQARQVSTSKMAITQQGCDTNFHDIVTQSWSSTRFRIRWSMVKLVKIPLFTCSTRTCSRHGCQGKPNQSDSFAQYRQTFLWIKSLIGGFTVTLMGLGLTTARRLFNGTRKQTKQVLAQRRPLFWCPTTKIKSNSSQFVDVTLTMSNDYDIFIAIKLLWFHVLDPLTIGCRLWGAGGMGGPPVRLVPENGCKQRRLGKGGYRGSGTRADLNNHANQMKLSGFMRWICLW